VDGVFQDRPADTVEHETERPEALVVQRDHHVVRAQRARLVLSLALADLRGYVGPGRHCQLNGKLPDAARGARHQHLAPE
jgi:hypothetical protein